MHLSFNLDHFYLVVGDQCFKELEVFFGSLSHTSIQDVRAEDSSWQGIYPFVQEGGFPEFLKQDKDNPIGKFGICLGHENIEEAFNLLKSNDINLELEFKDRRLKDGTEWFNFIAPLNQQTIFYTWALEWKGAYKQKRREWGKSPSNPLKRVIRIESNNIKENLDCFLKQFSPDTYRIKNSLDDFCELRKRKGSSFFIEFEVLNTITFPKYNYKHLYYKQHKNKLSIVIHP